MENFKKLPVIALRSMTILPDTMIHFDLIRKKSILAAEQAMSEDQEVFLVTQCHAETDEPAGRGSVPDRLYCKGKTGHEAAGQSGSRSRRGRLQRTS